MHYDKEGNKISLKTWGELMSEPDYKIIKQEQLPSGRIVSTIWLGLDPFFSGKGAPIIFESMVFPSKDNFSEISIQRYSTEEEALKGHEELVKEHI